MRQRIRWENLTKEQEIHNACIRQSLSLAHTYKGKEGTGIEPFWGPWEGVIQEEYRLAREARNPNIAGRREEQIIVREHLHSYKWSAYALCVDYCLYRIFPPLQELLKPCRKARFGRYKDGKLGSIDIPDIEGVVALIDKADFSWQIQPGFTGEMIAAECVQFLRRYREGAFVVFTLNALARYIYQDVKKERAKIRHLPFYLEMAGMERDDVRALVNEMAKVILSMPEYLSARVLSDKETRCVRSVCLQQLHQADERTKGVVATIDEFVSFCARLSEAENHILVPSGQYTIKQVPARLEHDVENQTARELMELPKYTAFTKMHQETDGTQTVWKGKMQTLKLPPGPEDVLTREVVKTRRLIIDVQSIEYLKWRDRIAEEITKRQESWRTKVVDEPPATHESKAEIVNIAQSRKWTPFRFTFEDILWVPKEPVVVPEDEPPPAHS